MIEARNLARSNPGNRDKERGRRKDESEESYAAARCTSSSPHIHPSTHLVPFHVCSNSDQTYQDSWMIHEMIKADNQSLGRKRKSQQTATQLKNRKGKQLGCYPLLMARVSRRRSMNQDMSLLRMNRFMIGSRRGTSCWVCVCKGGC